MKAASAAVVLAAALAMTTANGFAQNPEAAQKADGEPLPADSTASLDSAAIDSTAAPTPATPPVAAPVDPLQLYLRQLSDSTRSSFRDPALEALSISDASVDSLLRAYEETGDAPEDRGPREWKIKLGVAGARYNRVEGLNIMPEATIHAPSPRPLELNGRVGYGWSAKEFTGGAEARFEAARHPGHPTLHAGWAREVYAYGSGIAGGNTLTALMLGKDYGDYFRGEGWTAGAEISPEEFDIDVTMRAEKQESLANAAAYTVFKGDDAFRLNPSIDDGDLRLLEASARWSDRPASPWTARLTAGLAGRGLGGDFEYETARAEVVMRKRLWLGDRLIAAVAGGWVGDGTPFQALHHLGGFETLRGYDVNEFAARTFSHVRLDYEFGTNPFGWAPYLRRFRIQPVAFFDGASVFEEQLRDGTARDLDEPFVKFSSGLGLQLNLLGIPGGGGQLRFDVARRLDRGEDNMTYRARIVLRRSR